MRNKILIKILAALAVAVSLNVFATDGDVVYTAPYIWVNPETGQIETRNAGPRPKNHEQGPALAAGSGIIRAANAAEAEMEGPESAEEHTSLLRPLIVIAGMIAAVAVVTVMGRSRS